MSVKLNKGLGEIPLRNYFKLRTPEKGCGMITQTFISGDKREFHQSYIYYEIPLQGNHITLNITNIKGLVMSSDIRRIYGKNTQ